MWNLLILIKINLGPILFPMSLFLSFATFEQTNVADALLV